MVATFHIWFGKVSGGVDIFLLVSAYLMTRSLTARSEIGGFTRPVSYLIRKFSRLLPAAAAAILLILLAVFLFLPIAHWKGSISDALGSLFYVENIRLQQAAVDYFAADHSSASPFQHFWSLSVQGQVFVLFAFLHLVGDLVARKFRLPVRTVLLVMFALLAVGSFVYSVWLTAQSQAFAYFDTGARIWEFATGSVLALVHPWLRISDGFRTIASWLGVAAMLACGFVLPVESSFPGWAALWPVAAASLVILAAGTPTRFGADRILTGGLLHAVGGYTYALYLTHWPVLVVFLYVAEIEHADPLQGLIILVISAILSFLIARLVEQPMTRWLKRDRPAKSRWLPKTGWRSPLAILACISLVVGAASAGNAAVDRNIAADWEAVEHLPVEHRGANAESESSSDAAPVPAPTIVTSSWVPTGPDCAADDPYLTRLCYEIPAVNSPDGEEARTVFTLGSSHTGQFNGALLEAVNRHPSWTFRSQVAPGCYFQTREDVSDECINVWDQGARYIAETHPDLVVLFGTQTYEDFEMTQPNLVEWIAEASAASPETHFVTLRDNPRFPFSPFECAMQRSYDDLACSYEFETDTPPDYIEALEQAGAIWVDLNEFICPKRECRPTQGGVVTYLDDSHLTAPYVRTLAQKFTDAIRDDIGWWPRQVYLEGRYVDRATDDGLLADLNR